MFKKSTIDKLSDGIKQKTDDIADTLTDAIADISEAAQEKTDDISQTVGEWFDSNDSEPSVTINVDETTGSEQVVISVVEDDNKKNAFGSIVDEIKTRSKENNDLKSLIDNEKDRLKNERIEARNRNVFRKIKPVDNYISKKEEARDEQALQEFTKTKQEELNAARSERSREFAKKNKKTIAGLVAGVLVAGSAAGGVAIHSNNVAMAESYDQAVLYILAEDYDSAKNELTGISHEDAPALLSYASIQSDIDYYKGKPEYMHDALEQVEGIENVEVKNQYSEACDETEAAGTVQKDIDSIEITSMEDIPKDKVSSIENSISNIKERYQSLIDTQNLDNANAIIYALDNNTETGQLIKEIEDIGDVTLDSEEELKGLRSTYDGLAEDDKAIIFNYSDLTDAEEKYTTLKADYDKKIAEEKARKEAEEKAKREAEEEKRKQEEADERKRTAAAASEMQETEDYVWIPQKGKKYHSRSSCSNMKDPTKIKKSEAESRGYDPCKKCY